MARAERPQRQRPEAAGETEVTLPRAVVDAHSPSDAGGGLFGAIAIELGFCSEPDLVAAIASARDAASTADPPRLGEVLVAEGLLTPDQVRAVLDAQHKVVLACEECGRRFNAPAEPAQVTPACPHCAVPLQMPQAVGSIRVEDTVDRRAPGQAVPIGAGSYDELLGRTLGSYTILKLLGEGGMGAVFLAEHKLLKRKTALKVLPADLSHERERVRRFLREAEAMAQVRHPNIVGIHHVGSSRGLYFIEMELVEGGTLAGWLRDREVPSIDEAVAMFDGVCAGIEAAHERGIVHRDIKPDNVLIDDAGRPKMGDFGLAKAVEGAPGSQDLTAGENRVMGTPSYMSPEQANGEPADARSDVYSLGVVFFELLTGRKPFEGATPLAIMMQHLRDEAPPPQRFRPDLPRSLSNIVERTLAKAPDERYQSAQELRTALAAFRQGAAVAYTARRIRRRRWRVAVGLCVLAVASAGGGALYAELQKRGQTRIVKVGETRAETLTRLAREAEGAYAGGKWEDLRAALQRLESMAPAHPVLALRPLIARHERAAAAWVRGDPDAVIAETDAVLAVLPGDDRATRLRARAVALVAARQGLADRDVAACRAGVAAVLAEEPAHPEATAIGAAADACARAAAGATAGDWVTSATDAAAALAARPGDPWATALRAAAVDALQRGVAEALRGGDLPGAEAAAAALVSAGAAATDAVAAGVRRTRADYERWCATGKDALAAGDAARARAAFESALVIWRDAPLAALRATAIRDAWRARIADRCAANDYAAGLDDLQRAADDGVPPAALADLRGRCAAGLADVKVHAARGALQAGDLEAALAGAEAALALVAHHPGAVTLRTEALERRACPDGFVYVPAGDYPLGAADEPANPPHRVRLAAYYIAVHEITNRDFARFVADGGYTTDRWWDAEAVAVRAQYTDASGRPGPKHWVGGAARAGSEAEPVTGVCWYEARAYARWAGGRLPTEAEWEVAASYDPTRGAARAYPWGDTWDAARVGLTGGGGLAPVGDRRGDVSPFGVRDAAGNALEWTADRWVADTPHRVIRGGGTHRLAVASGRPDLLCRAAHRQMRADPGAARLAVVGFRVVRDPGAEGGR